MSTFLRYSGLIFSLLIYSLLGVPAMAQDEAQQKQFQALVTQHLRFPEAGAAVAIIAPRQTAGVVYSGKFNGETVLPLGRLGELFTTVILQHVLAEQKLKRDDPVNDHLEGLRLLESRGEITLQDLLQRSSGLAWRQSGLYVDNPKLGVDLRTLLEQDLKPTVMEPAQVAVSHSMGDLVIGQLLASQYQQKLAEIIQSQILTPLALDSIQLGAIQAQPRYTSGYDSQGLPWPTLWASAHEVHGYQGQFSDLARFFQGLTESRSPTLKPASQRIFRKSLTPDSDLPTSSEGLLMSSWAGQDYFYLDSDLFGYTLRLAYFPQFKQGFVLAYNQSSPTLKEAWTQAFIQSQTTTDMPLANISDTPVTHSAFVALRSRDQHTWLKVLDLLSWRRFHWNASEASQQAEFEGVTYTGALPSALKSQTGQKLLIDPEQHHLLLGFGEARGYALVPIWQRLLHWLFLSACLILFLSVLIRSLLFLWAYEPQFDYSLEPKSVESADASQPEPDKSETATDSSESIPSWDIPSLAAFSSACASGFLLGFYPVLFWVSGVGDQLSFVVRNAPGTGLIVLLVLPLFALVSALIFSLLLLNEWRARPWARGERLHYLSYIVTLFVWVAWLAHWNLLGFNF